ncbi:MAG: hypothetical protein ACXVPQ_00695 [Bacteroidia bacterium]
MGHTLRIVFVCFAGLVCGCSYAQSSVQGPFKYSVTLLEGKWHIAASNFSTWTQGTKTDPGNVYSDFRIKGSALQFSDLITFKKNGEVRKIKGKLKQKKSDKLEFIWRGKGLLFVFRSKWKIIASDSEGQWIALYSPGTLTSPEGVDIISRQHQPSEKKVKEIISHLDKTYVKKPVQVLNR